MIQGEAFHARKAVIEGRSRSAISRGWWLIALAFVLAILSLIAMVS